MVRKQWQELQSIETEEDPIIWKRMRNGCVVYTTKNSPNEKKRVYARFNKIYRRSYNVFETGFDLASQICSINSDTSTAAV
jgi:hypothetical protein